jgi:hypothetical protein
MSQADSQHSEDLPRLSFQSLNAVPRVPPRLPRHITQLPAVQVAFTSLITELAQHTPHAIVGNAADRFDILERAEHLKAVLAAVHAYVQAVVKDTAYFSVVNIRDETAGLVDTSAEIVSALLNANDRLQDLGSAADE